MSIMKKSTAMLLAVLMLLSSFACLAVSAVDTYTKVTSLSQITAGGKYLVVYAADNSYVTNTITSGKIAKGATVTGDSVSTPDASLVWTLEASATSGKFYMKNDATEKYLGDSTSGTSAQLTTTAVDLAITSSSVENAFILTFTNGTNERELAYYATASDFRMYATTTGDATTSFYLYKLGGSTPAPAGTNTIYFTNNKGWSNVYVYAWNDTTSEQNAAFNSAPAMQYVETNSYGEGIYSYNCSTSYDHVIFHNGDGVQTVDVATADIFANGNNAVYPDQLSGGKYTVGYWKYEAAAQTTFHVVVDYDGGDDSKGLIQDYDDYYEAGTTLDFVAEPETGYVFDGWYLVSGANRTLISNNAEYTYTVTADANIVAVFTQPAAKYEVLVGAGANGTVSPEYADEYSFGTTLSSTATPASGYKFVRWEDGDGVEISTDATITFTVNKNIEYYAIFAEDVVVETGYNKVTSASELTANGKYLFVLKDKDIAVGNGHTAVETTAATFATPDSTIVWTLEKSGDNFLIKNESSGKYLCWGSSTTGAMKDAADAVANAVSENGDGTFSVVETVNNSRRLAYYESGNNFRWYALSNTNPYKFEIYKFGEVAPAVETTKLYFTNPGWSKVQVYAWDSTKEGVENAPFASAPEMTFVENNEFNQGVYVYDLPETYDKVIFHNGEGTQSSDIAVSAIYANGNNAVYLDGSTVGYWKYEAPTPKKVDVLTECDTTMGTITVSAPADGKDYYVGEEVTFTATAKTGYTFVAWCDENDTAVSSNATYKITLTDDVYLIAEFVADGEEPPVTVDEIYNKITTDAQITTGGKYVFVLKDKVNEKDIAIANPATGTTVKSAEVTVAASIKNPDDAVIWTLEVSGKNFVIKNVKSGKYIKGSASATTTTLVDTAEGADVVFESNNDGSFSIYESTKKRYFAYLASSDVFKTYASGSNPKDFYIYKLGAEAPAPTTSKVYFTKPNDWSKVQVYAWSSTDETVKNAEFASAPEMTYVADNKFGQGIYSYDLADTYDRVIFHNGAGAQTPDVTVSAIYANGNNAVYVDGNTVGYWKYEEAPAKVEVTVTATSEDEEKGIADVSKPADGKKYYTGEEVTFTAVADTGYVFSGWYDDKDVLVSEDEEYKVTLTGDLELTAKFVSESQAPSSDDKDYTKVTSASAITAGDYIFVITSANVAINSTKTGTEVTAGDKISTHDNTIVWTLEAAEGGFVIKNKDTGKYMKGTSSGATLTFADTGIVVAFTDNNDGTFKLISAEINNKKLAYYNNQDFRWYAQSNSSPSDFYVYKLGSGTPTVDENALFFTNTEGWSKVQVYAWNETTHVENAAFASAPEMTFVENNEFNQGIYTYSLDKTKYDHVIFHNGTAQTPDIAVADIYANGNNAVYMNGSTPAFWKYGTVVVAPVEVSVEADTDNEAMGTVSVSAPATGDKYYEGDEVTFTATAKTGYVFTGWYDMEDTVVSKEAAYTFTLGKDDIFLIAHFAEEGDEPEPDDDIYNKITSLSQITTDGKYVLVLKEGDLAVDNTLHQVAITGTSIKNPDAAIVWVIEKSGDYFVIKNEAVSKYIDWTTGTTARMYTEGEPVYFVDNENGTFSIVESTGTRRMGYYASGINFRWYALNSSNAYEFYIYKLGATAPVPETKTTIYFTKPNDWSKVQIYAWSSTDETVKNAEFANAPEMTFVENNQYGQGIYSYELSDKYDRIIFHNGAGAQTSDINVEDVYENDNNAVYLDGSTVGYWKYEPSVPVKVDVAAESDDTTMGTVAISDPADGKDYYTGEEVTFTATAKAGYKFIGWFDMEDELVSNKATYKVTLTEDVMLIAKFEAEEEPEDKVYNLVTKLAQIAENGEYVIVLASTSSAVNSALKGAEVAVASNAITNPAEAVVWVVEKSGDNFVLKNASTGKYLNWSSSSTATMVDSAEDAEPVTFVDNGDGTFKIVAALEAAGNKHLGYLSSSDAFKWYAPSNTNPSNFYFYKLGEVEEEETFTTVYFTNGEGWTDVRIYAWNDTTHEENAAFASAPKMTLVGKNEFDQDIYSYELSDKYDHVIFHNGTAQTVDVTVSAIFANGNNAVYPSTQENGKFTVGYWKYEDTTPEKVDVAVDTDNATMGSASVSAPADGKDYYTGETVTFTATAKPGYKFVGWYDLEDKLVSDKASYSVKLTGDVELIAVFEAETQEEEKFELTVEQATGGSIAGAQSGAVTAGTSITLTATANEGYKFVKWVDDNGTQLSTNSVYTFVVNANTYVTAVFKKLYKVTAAADKAAAGTVNKTLFYVDDNETFTITATAKTGYIFAGWTKSGSATVISTNSTLSTTVSADTNFIAKFNQRGDVNADGNVTTVDVQQIQDYLTGKTTLTAAQQALADVNADGSVDLLDAYLAYSLTK